MADLTIAFDVAELRGDLVLGVADVATGDDLKTSILVSLFSDPGWWANTYEADDWGSRLLDLRASKRTNATRLRAEDYCRKALAWLVTDGVARWVDVSAAWEGTTLQIGIVVTQATGITRYSFAWKEV